MLKAHKIRIYPTEEQEKFLNQNFGNVRFFWNRYRSIWLANAKMKFREDHQWFNVTIAELKQIFPFLAIGDYKALEQARIDFERAIKNWKNGYGFPKRKKMFQRESYRILKSQIKIDGNYASIGKLKHVKLAETLRFKGEVRNATVSRSKSGKYFISFLVDTENFQLPSTDKVIGGDLGLTDFFITSDGAKIPNLHFLRESEQKVKQLQRKLSRQKKGSGRWKITKKKIAKMYEKITNQRTDFLQKTSTQLIYDNQVIVLEDLNVEGMKKNSKLAKSISDVSWDKFVKMLTYKADWYGRKIITISRFFPSSQYCSNCGHLDGKKPLNIREWTCSECQTHHDRDINAAINIRNEGLKQLA